MGMYNEVFKICPECGKRAEMQISQIVLGFGGFDLDNYHTLEALNSEQLLTLKSEILQDNFKCANGHYFNPYVEKTDGLVRELFDVNIPPCDY